MIGKLRIRLQAVSAVVALSAIPGGLRPAHGQSFKSLYAFAGGADGAYPYDRLARDGQGNLYGTTDGGGAFGYGTIFKLTSSGIKTILYNFTGGTDGANPYSGLIFDAQRNAYGATTGGGDPNCNPAGTPSGCGVVYRL